MAALYLMLPYTAYHVAQVHHVWPVAFILWAVYCLPATGGGRGLARRGGRNARSSRSCCSRSGSGSIVAVGPRGSPCRSLGVSGLSLALTAGLLL